jgi:Mn2+/Fe2+ NRAMP family transporter
MAAIQGISAGIGAVTGRGIAENLRRHYPPWVMHLAVMLLLVANFINIGADLAAMGAALRLLVDGSQLVYAVIFGLVCVGLEIFISYRRYVTVLKWLTLSLFAYVAVVLAVDVPWATALQGALLPQLVDSKRQTDPLWVRG